MTPETFESGTVEAPIKNYNKAMPLIPDFDGSNVETFINHIQIASKRLAVDQHELFLCGIVAQKLVGRAKHSIRTDTTPNFPQLYEKLRYLYGKARNLSALEVQRDTCIQRTNESIDEFINRFLRIQDDIIHTVNSQSTGIATICLQEQMYQQKAVEVFRRNVKTEISDHLYSFEFTQLNEAFSKARAFEAELQLRKLRTQRYETSKKPFQPRTHFQTKECTYCKRRRHEEKECRTKVFHQQRGQQNFRERQSFNRPPDRASHHLRATDHAGSGREPQRKVYQGPGGTYVRAPRIKLKIPGFKDVIFLVDTGSDISLIHEMFIDDKNLPKTNSIIVSGVTTHSIKTKYGVIIEMFGKKHTFHVLDDYSPVQHQGILHIDFLTANNFVFSNEYLKLNGKEFKRCDKPLSNDTYKQNEVLVIFKDDTGAITRMNDFNKPILPTYLHSQIKSVEDYCEAPIYSITKETLNNTLSELLKENTRLLHLPEHYNEIWDIILEFYDIFTLPGDPLPLIDLMQHEIKTHDENPIHIKQYRYPPIHQEEIKRQIKDMLAKGIIQESDSPYNSPLWIVPKKQDASGKNKWRLVIDYRKLNEKTIQDAYPLPNIDEILDQLGNARYFSAFDLASGFHQIGMNPKDVPKTAFSTPNGHYEYTRMPFGLKNAPPTFQRMMNKGLKGLIGNNCFVYIDDIIVYGKTIEEHNKNLRILFERLRQVGLKLQPDKCEYLRPELEYLGHVISEHGIQPNPDRIEKVRTYSIPKTPKEIKQFLGLVGYYRKFIKDFSKVAKPLTRLLQKSSIFQWTSEQQESPITSSVKKMSD